MFVFLSYRKNFVGTQKRIQISHGKRAIGVRVIGVRLYMSYGLDLAVPSIIIRNSVFM